MVPKATAAAALTVLLLASGAEAAITVVAESGLTTSVVAPPVRFELGAGGAATRYFSPFTLSSNATSVSGVMVGRAGADVFAKDALRIVNARASPQSVTLAAGQLASAQLDVFQWLVYDGSTLIATLDVESASPSVAFTLPASTTYRLDARMDLADGAGRNNAPASFQVQLAIDGGGIRLEHTTSALSLDVATVEVPFGKLASGSTVGANATNASASMGAGVVVMSTANAFYLNNTNASAPWYVKIVYVASSGAAQLTTGNLGVNNGTSVDHVTTSSGSVTQSSGSYQRLEPGSTNRLYVESLEGVLFGGATIDFDVYASDTPSGASYTVSKGRITLT